MNKERLLMLADLLESPQAEKHFNQMTWIENEKWNAEEDDTINVIQGMSVEEAINTCGTTACIAGWACVLAHPEMLVDEVNVCIEAQDWLGLTEQQANNLFAGSYNTDPKVAAKIVRQFVETGIVDHNIHLKQKS